MLDFCVILQPLPPFKYRKKRRCWHTNIIDKKTQRRQHFAPLLPFSFNAPVKPPLISNKLMNQPIFLNVHIFFLKTRLGITAEIKVVRHNKSIGNDHIFKGNEDGVNQNGRISVIKHLLPARNNSLHQKYLSCWWRYEYRARFQMSFNDKIIGNPTFPIAKYLCVAFADAVLFAFKIFLDYLRLVTHSVGNLFNIGRIKRFCCSDFAHAETYDDANITNSFVLADPFIILYLQVCLLKLNNIIFTI